MKAALTEAARKMRISYDDLKQRAKGERRLIHDDITVVVLFIDHELLEQNGPVSDMSIRGFIDTVGSSRFDLEGVT